MSYLDFKDHTLLPPGTNIDFRSNPLLNENSLLYIGIVNEHRFAFYYWNRIKITEENKSKEKKINFDLISIDWHTDLGEPSDLEIQALEDIDLENFKRVAIVNWENLNPINDRHILTAVHFDIINDVYILCKQSKDRKFSYKDISGKMHSIKVFKSETNFYACIKKLNNKNFFFDIDLDYFVENEETDNWNKMYIKDINKVKDFLSLNNKTIELILKNSKLLTIAQEPSYCGGIKNSNIIMDILNDSFFNGMLLNDDHLND